MKRWHNRNAPGCQHNDKDDSPDDLEGDTTAEEEYLKSFGDSVATMLDPFGRILFSYSGTGCMPVKGLYFSQISLKRYFLLGLHNNVMLTVTLCKVRSNYLEVGYKIKSWDNFKVKGFRTLNVGKKT